MWQKCSKLFCVPVLSYLPHTYQEVNWSQDVKDGKEGSNKVLHLAKSTDKIVNEVGGRGGGGRGGGWEGRLEDLVGFDIGGVQVGGIANKQARDCGSAKPLLCQTITPVVITLWTATPSNIFTAWSCHRRWLGDRHGQEGDQAASGGRLSVLIGWQRPSRSEAAHVFCSCYWIGLHRGIALYCWFCYALGLRTCTSK